MSRPPTSTDWPAFEAVGAEDAPALEVAVEAALTAELVGPTEPPLAVSPPDESEPHAVSSIDAAITAIGQRVKRINVTPVPS